MVTEALIKTVGQCLSFAEKAPSARWPTLVLT